MYCPVHWLYTITCGAFISRQKQMSLPSSCLGVHQWKPAVRCSLECVHSCAHTCVFEQKEKKKQYLCEHTREQQKKKRKERVGGRMLQMAMLLCTGMLTVGHRKASQLGGGQDFSPLGLQSLTGSQQKTEERRAEYRCMIGTRAKGTAASYPFLWFTMHHSISDNRIISTRHLNIFQHCYSTNSPICSSLSKL